MERAEAEAIYDQGCGVVVEVRLLDAILDRASDALEQPYAQLLRRVRRRRPSERG